MLQRISLALAPLPRFNGESAKTATFALEHRTSLVAAMLDSPNT